MRSLFIIGVMLSTTFSHALEFRKEDLKVAVGGQYLSDVVKRGQTVYGGYQLVPILSVDLFNPNLYVAGSSLYFVYGVDDGGRILRLRFNPNATGDKPLYYTSEEKEERIRRESTSEFDIFLEQQLERGEIRVQVSQDLVAHKGTYAEIFGRWALADFLEKNGKPLLQPGLFASIGAGNRDHNVYLYGDGARDWSFNNFNVGLSITSPAAIDVFFPTFSVSYYEILGHENRTASEVDEAQGWQVMALAAFRVW